MILQVHPGKIRGEMSVPSSKSHTIRALVVATLAPGKSVIRNPLLSADCITAARNVQQFGAKIDKYDGYWEVQGTGGKLSTPDDIVNVDNSGTTLYFLTAMACLNNEYSVFTGDASIRTRPVQPLLDALIELGAEGSTTRFGTSLAPFFVKGPIHGGEVKVPCQTSQYTSALLLSCPLAQNKTRITTENPLEIPYIEMTIEWLKACGITINYDETNYEFFELEGNQEYESFDKIIPSDWSSVAFPVVAALSKGSELIINNMDFEDSQGDAAVIDYLIQMGANIQKDQDQNRLIIKGDQKLQGTKIDIKDTPDALPILCVAGTMAEGVTELVNVAGARVKETDRVDVMTKILKQMGADIEDTENTVTIKGGKQLKGMTLDSHGDHRIAMSIAVAGLTADGPTGIIDAECASVTFPNFYDNFRAAGVKITEQQEEETE